MIIKTRPRNKKLAIAAPTGETKLLQNIYVPTHQPIEAIIGVYEGTFPEPDVFIDASSEQASSLEASITRVEDRGEYKLICRLHNRGAAPCEVAVMERSAA